MEGIANPWPVKQRADQQDQPVPGFQLVQTVGHPGDPRGVLTGAGRRNGWQKGRGKALGTHSFECVRVGESTGHRLESRSFQVDELPDNPLAEGSPQGCDHTLAGINGHVAEAELGVVAIDIKLSNHRNGWQPLDARLDVFLEGGWQRYGHTVIRAAEQLLAHADRAIARTMNDRQHPDPRTDRQKIVRVCPRFLHHRPHHRNRQSACLAVYLPGRTSAIAVARDASDPS